MIGLPNKYDRKLPKSLFALTKIISIN